MSEYTQQDLQAARERYSAERDKRIRDDGNEQYIEVVGDFAHYIDDPYVEAGDGRVPVHREVDVLVIGGGFGGLLAGARLREAGVKDIALVEKGGDFGGTWYWNRYPGAQCDVESYIYLPLLEELGYIPREKYSHAAEILAHSRAIGEHFGLYEGALFQTQVTDLRWGDDDARWCVKTDRGDEIRARFVIMANGPLNRSYLPYQSLGLPVHRWQRRGRPGPAGRQAGRRDRHRRNRGAVRAPSRRDGAASLRVPAHTVEYRHSR
jgi:cyclohexanone monooxygenase